MIPRNTLSAQFFEFGDLMGFLRTIQCLFQELDDFRKSLSESAEEKTLWQQCEKRLQETETYRGLLSKEMSDLVMIHAIRSHALKKEKSCELNGRQK
jgi:hypothetical protein